MLLDGTANLHVRHNIFYVGGCPTATSAATTALFNEIDRFGNNAAYSTNWLASSAVGPAGHPGEFDPTTLTLKQSPLANPDLSNLPGATTQCFEDVKSTPANQVDNLFMVTSTSCGAMADTVTSLNTAGGGCNKSCKLGPGGDSTADCAVRILHCMAGTTREVKIDGAN
jgi:hypothetical protein